MTTDTVLTIDPRDDLTLVAGQATTLRLRIAIAPDFHVQANPASDEFLVPLQLQLEPRSDIHAEAPSYPPGSPYRLQGADSDLLIYEGTFGIDLPIVAEPTAPPGNYTLSGQIRYQACDAHSCLAPASVPIDINVRVVETATRSV